MREDMQEFIDRLTANGVEFSERKAHNSNLYQLFMREPINGIKVELNFAEVMMRRLTITGSTLRPRPVAFKSAIAQSLRQHVWPLIAAGRIKPVIHSTFPAARAADAHALMESNANIGKILLDVRPS